MPPKRDLQITRPEERELVKQRAELSALESQLAEREVELATLRAELGAFERKYLAEVGLRYAELDDLKAQLAERIAAENPHDLRLQEAARRARARAKATRSTAGQASSQGAFTPSPEIKRLYRDVARRIHPDLTSDDADRARRQELMAEANRAYVSGDKAGLTRVIEAYECSPERIHGEGAGADLVRTIRRISQVKGRLDEIAAEMQTLLASDSHRLRMQFEEASRRKINLFSELSRRIESEVTATNAALAEHAAVVAS